MSNVYEPGRRPGVRVYQRPVFQVAAQISRQDAVVAINKWGLIRPFSDSVLFQNQ